MTAASRLLRFNAVGVAGFVVQLVTLWVLTDRFDVETVVAVPLAVMVAVTHNFIWHERVTWPLLDGRLRWRRWIVFNVSNGFTSLVTNTVITTTAVMAAGAPLLVANVAAVAATSLINFFVCDRVVFSRT